MWVDTVKARQMEFRVVVVVELILLGETTK